MLAIYLVLTCTSVHNLSVGEGADNYAHSTIHIITLHICRPSPSNQSFYRLIAGYQRGAGDHRVGQGLEGSWAYKIGLVVHWTMHAAPHAPQLRHYK